MTTIDSFEGLIETFAGPSAHARPEPRDGVDAHSFRESMARVCGPVSIVTTLTKDGTPYGTTVSAFASLSLEPAMVIVSLGRTSHLLGHVEAAGVFSVNVLAETQRDLAAVFARSGGDKFAGVRWTMAEHLPRLSALTAWLACDVIRLVDGGDHTVVLAAVTRAECSDRLPLIYARQTFGTHSVLAQG